jgi:tubulin-folding cofactor B
VTDKSPNKISEQFTDTSLVDKFELPDEEYSKLQDSVRAFKQRNKLGRFAAQDAETAKKLEADEARQTEAANTMKVGDRCEVDGGDMGKRGVIRYIGTPSFKPGTWIGIEYDEPLGKNDGEHAYMS